MLTWVPPGAVLAPAAGAFRGRAALVTVPAMNQTRRTVQFDPARLREDYAEAGRALVATAGAVPPDAWDSPGLGEWTIRDLVGHTSRSFVTVSEYLASGAGRAIELAHAFDYVRALALVATDPAAVTERGRVAGRALGADPVAGVRSLFETATTDIAAHGDDAPCATLAGVMRLADYLPSRIFELVVHTDDLRRALSLPAESPVGARVVALAFAAGLAGESDRYAEALRGLTGRAAPERFSVV